MNIKHIVGGVLFTASLALTVAAIANEVDEDGGHLKIENPAQVSDAELTAIYEKLQSRMVKGYALSQHPVAKGYPKWQQYNSASYLSSTHGNRYVNSFANAKAKGYGTLSRGDKMPVGSVLAKDSFTVTDGGDVFPGALFVMEKLTAGTSPQHADWRYVMVMPDGSLFGDTMGDGAEEVEFCHTCHKVQADTDYLYTVPKKYRLKAE